jgi:kynurenine formamidase
VPRLVDLSQTIAAGMPVYPGDEPTELTQTRYLEQHHHNNHRLCIGMHAGTHLDGPMHMLPGNTYVSQLPLQPFISPGCVIDVRGQSDIRWKPEYEHAIKDGYSVLFYTGYDHWYGSDRYWHHHPCLHPEICDHLVRKSVRLLGVDLPSPDQPPFPIHKRLLGNGVYILENLANLGQLLGVPNFELIALPLKLEADGSPVRAVARI